MVLLRSNLSMSLRTERLHGVINMIRWGSVDKQCLCLCVVVEAGAGDGAALDVFLIQIKCYCKWLGPSVRWLKRSCMCLYITLLLFAQEH